MKYWIVRLLSLVAAIGGCLLLQMVLMRPGVDAYTQRLVVLAGLYVTLSVSLNLINGITGQFSIGHAAFYQIGAYLAGYLSIHYYQNAARGLGSDPIGSLVAPFVGSSAANVTWLFLLLFIGAAGAAVAGLVVGLPSLRLRGDYLAIVTLGFGEIIRIIVQNQPALGGSYGMNVQPKYQPMWLVWLLAVVCIAVCRNLLKTAHGLPFLAVREDEIAGAAMGVNVTKVKVTAFMIGSAFAGAAGALLAHYEGFITPTQFGMDVSFIILTMVVLGGTGSITGSALAAVFLSYLPEYLRGLKGANGADLTVNGATVVAGLLALTIAVGLVKRIMDHYHGPKLNRAGFYLGSLVVGYLAFVGLALALTRVPQLAAFQVSANQLRMVIFAVTLIALMLLRPQGVFGHHEFSWSWLRRLFGQRDVPQTAVAT